MVAPLALSVSNPGIVPLVPASDAVKENVGTAPALPSPAAILPDQSCIETEVSFYKKNYNLNYKIKLQFKHRK